MARYCRGARSSRVAESGKGGSLRLLARCRRYHLRVIGFAADYLGVAKCSYERNASNNIAEERW
jgi:hypothetical protein